MTSIIHFGTLQRTTGNFGGSSGLGAPNHTLRPAQRAAEVSRALEFDPNECKPI
jgi:hypothetical protein